MGGYNNNGLAWRYELPPSLLNKFTINLLEFIASAITIVLTLRATKGSSKVLAYTDSSSALGWLFKASFSTSQPIHDKVARWLASILMLEDSALYSQHIRGIHNFISDCLSRDDHLSDIKLTYAFHALLPKQTPKNFKISNLPPDIVCWLHSLSPSTTKTTELPSRPSRSKLGALTAGNDSSKQWESTIRGLNDIKEGRKRICCQRSQAVVDEINLVQQARQ
jgi:hypothetical protein